MKAPILKTALLVAGVSFLVGCQKDVSSELNTEDHLANKAAVTKENPQERPFKGKFVSASEFVPDVANHGGITVSVLAWFPGEGEGNVTHMGNVKVIYNQYALPVFIPDRPYRTVEGRNAPLLEYYTPDQLMAFGLTSEEVENLDETSFIFMDRHGCSVWGKARDMEYAVHEWGLQYNMPTPYPMPSLFEVQMTIDIIGGTGRFEGATGEVTLHGFSERPVYVEPSIDRMELDGYIKY